MAPISRAASLGLIIAKASAFTPASISNPTTRALVTTASPFLASATTPTNNSNSSPRQPMARRMIGSILDLLSGGDGGMISPENAMKGRPEKMKGIEGLKHYVLHNNLEEVPEGYEQAVFANGCFWGSEKAIW